MFRKVSIILIAAVSISFSTPIYSAISQKDSYVLHIEHMLQKVPYPSLSEPYEICGTRSKLLEIEDALKQIIDCRGPDGQAYYLLGKVQMRLGKYPQALQSFKSSVPAYPDETIIKREIKKARLITQIAEDASGGLPSGQQILQIEKYPIASSDGWIILTACGTVNKDFVTNFTEGRLTLFRGTSRQLRKTWQSDKLIFAYDDKETLNEMTLFVKDITGDGIPETMVHNIVQGAWWSPSHMDVFSIRNGKMMKLLGVRSEFPLEVIDIDSDGRYEIIRKEGIGAKLARAEQPVWTDIYTYKRGVYELSNGDYPEQFLSLNKEIKARLWEHPDDPKLLKHKAILEKFILKTVTDKGK